MTVKKSRVLQIQVDSTYTIPGKFNKRNLSPFFSIQLVKGTKNEIVVVRRVPGREPK